MQAAGGETRRGEDGAQARLTNAGAQPHPQTAKARQTAAETRCATGTHGATTASQSATNPQARHHQPAQAHHQYEHGKKKTDGAKRHQPATA